MNKFAAVTAATLALIAACTSTTPSTSPSASSAPAPTGPMSFFITSVGSGKGADLGGIAGADAICQRLATAAGAGNRTWRAYLSTPNIAASGANPAVPAVHARDRIGKGPWFNAKRVQVARDVDHLHSGNSISKETALDERGNAVNARGQTPLEHDILTGSRDDGTAFAPHTDTTCRGWTHGGPEGGSAILGHHDRAGPTQDNWSKSWNFSHQSAGCSQEALVRTGGTGRFYCFAAN